MNCLYAKPIKYEFPESSKGKVGRFIMAPRGPWGGYDFIVNDVPYYQRVRSSFIDEATLKRRGARPLMITTHNFNYDPSYQQLATTNNQSETMGSFSGSKYLLGPLPRPTPAMNQHYYRHRIIDAESDPLENISITKENYTFKEISNREEQYSQFMNNMNRMTGKDVRLILNHTEPVEHPYRSSYSSAHNHMNRSKIIPAKSRIYNSDFVNSSSVYAGPMHPRPKTAPAHEVQFRRISGNRILSARRPDQSLILN